MTREEKDFSDYSMFNEVLEIEHLNVDTTRLQVLSIKTGDVTGDAINRHTVNQTSVSPESYGLTFENQWLTAGKPSTINIKASRKGLAEGLQMALTGSELTIVGIEGKSIAMPQEHYNIDESRTLLISSNMDEPLLVNKNDILYTIINIPHYTGYLDGNL